MIQIKKKKYLFNQNFFFIYLCIYAFYFDENVFYFMRRIVF